MCPNFSTKERRDPRDNKATTTGHADFILSAGTVLHVIMAKKPYRPDRDGTHRKVFDKNKKIIYATQDVCGICGKPVDKTIKEKYHPMAPCIDHIVPISKGGHPSDISNLQLAHRICNRLKSDKVYQLNVRREEEAPDVRDLPQSMSWKEYRAPK